jgi:hypothetical protein
VESGEVMASSATTKDLGEQIAAAVLEVADTANPKWSASYRLDAAVHALFQVLDEHKCWFVWLSEHADGTRFEQLPPL